MNPIAILNDAFRTDFHPLTGDWIATCGVKNLGPLAVMRAVRAVIACDAFTPDNDPYGEHDFGSFELDGRKLFWKIDCYAANDMTMGSADPADPAVTRRVLTIMLASEY